MCNQTGVICKPEEAFATVTISPAQALSGFRAPLCHLRVGPIAAMFVQVATFLPCAEEPLAMGCQPPCSWLSHRFLMTSYLQTPWAPSKRWMWLTSGGSPVCPFMAQPSPAPR